MSEVVAGTDVSGNPGTVVLDLDGVVYVEHHGVPGAGDALRRLEDAGFTVLFATNNSTKTPASAAAAITEATGYSCRPEQVVSSSLVTARSIAGTHRRVLVVGEAGLTETLAAEGIEVVTDWREADAVVVGLNRDVRYADLAAAVLAIRVGGAAFLATNTDATFPTRDGPAPGGGAIAGAIAIAAGVEPRDFGKPLEPFRAIVRSLAVAPVVMVGDRPETDIAMGKAEGWTTVLALTGVTGNVADVPEAYRPDHVVDSIADLPGLLGA
jgi:4-nitrophenyl phosphatase